MVYRPTSQTRERDRATRVAILEAARALVGERGLDGTTIAAVAEAAGVGIGTVYRQFPSKSDLVCEVVRSVCRQELEVVASIAAADRPARERLVDAVTVFARRALRSGRTAHAMIFEPALAEVEVLRLEIRAELADLFAAIVADGVADGAFPPQSAAISGTALVGAVSEVLVGPLSPVRVGAAGDPAELLDAIARFAIRAVAPALAVDEVIAP